jgi:hypothetical protein
MEKVEGISSMALIGSTPIGQEEEGNSKRVVDVEAGNEQRFDGTRNPSDKNFPLFLNLKLPEHLHRNRT